MFYDKFTDSGRLSPARAHTSVIAHKSQNTNPSLCAATRGSEAAHLAAAAATARQAFIRGRPQRKGGPAGPCVSRPPILGRANGKQAQARDCCEWRKCCPRLAARGMRAVETRISST